MDFRTWLENKEDDFSFWADLLTNYLNLDEDNGLFVNIEDLDIQDLLAKITNLGEFAQLPADRQRAVIEKIESPNPGNIQDIVDIMSGRTD